MALFLFACGSPTIDGDGNGDDAGTPDAGPAADASDDGPFGPDFDYTNATWTLTNVSQSEGTLSHAGSLAIRGDEMQVLFAEPRAEQLSDQDIYRASFDGGTWSTESLTPTLTTQLASPAVTATPDAYWYAWIGRENRNDLLNDAWALSPETGGDLAQPLNLSNGLAGRQVRELSAVREANGSVFVFHLTGTNSPNQTVFGTTELTSDGIVFSSVTPPIPATCRGLRTRTNIDGRARILMTCSPGTISHLEFSGNTLVLTDVPRGDTQADSADFAFSGDRAVHVVWTAIADCPEGRCRGVYYSRNFGAPRLVSDLPGFKPVIGVDPFGRPVIAFHVSGETRSIMITHSNDGVTFAEPRALPNEGNRDNSASDLQIEFSTGRPHLLFDRVITGSSPLNSEVIHATVL